MIGTGNHSPVLLRFISSGIILKGSKKMESQLTIDLMMHIVVETRGGCRFSLLVHKINAEFPFLESLKMRSR